MSSRTSHNLEIFHLRSSPRAETVGLIVALLLLTLVIGIGARQWLHFPAREPDPSVRAQSAPARSVPGGVPEIGEPAPDFTLPSLQHGTQSLARWRGQPVIINFWASWCGPCRREMPLLIDASTRYQEQDLVILAVNLSYQDTPANLAAFVEEFQVPFPVLLDMTGEVAENLYGARGVPMSYVIDADGNLRHIYMGAITQPWLDEVMAAINKDH